MFVQSISLRRFAAVCKWNFFAPLKFLGHCSGRCALVFIENGNESVGIGKNLDDNNVVFQRFRIFEINNPAGE